LLYFQFLAILERYTKALGDALIGVLGISRLPWLRVGMLRFFGQVGIFVYDFEDFSS
jgi:hypothetical protein